MVVLWKTGQRQDALEEQRALGCLVRREEVEWLSSWNVQQSHVHGAFHFTLLTRVEGHQGLPAGRALDALAEHVRVNLELAAADAKNFDGHDNYLSYSTVL